MRQRKWIYTLASILMVLGVSVLLAQDHGRGRDRDEDEGERHRARYSEHDREEIRHWRDEHRENLPPGLARKDRLPPGLERQLRIRRTLPPGLRDRIQPCPEELERRLPPPPPDCAHVVIGGHIVLLNRKTFMVLDIFHFEL